MTALPIYKTTWREKIPQRITRQIHHLEPRQRPQYYDKEAEELAVVLKLLQVEPQAGIEHDAMLEKLTPQLHNPESMDGIPYYDEEFGMAQSLAHKDAIKLLLELMGQIATRIGLKDLSDNPVWYMTKEGKRKQLYPDYALTSKNLDSITAKELLLAVEVVSTKKIEIEKKDTERMYKYNEWNGVPEFILIYPERHDMRALVWYRYNAEKKSYQEMTLSEERRYRSESIPGLEIEVLDASEWKSAKKIRIYYQGEELLTAEQERVKKEAAERRVEQLIALLKQSGISFNDTDGL